MTRRHEYHLDISLAIGLVIMCTICITTQAQLGFVSIDCGSSTSYNDTDHQFLWESDAKYTLTGLNAEVPDEVNASSDNSIALKTFRYFPDHRQKHCYDLSLTTSNVSVLIRAMFLHGGSALLTLPITFDVYVNNTQMGTVNYGIYESTGSSPVVDTPIVMEGIFPCPGSVVHFCLVPQKGVPFISSLELRQLDPDGLMYYTSLWTTTKWFSTLERINCGASYNSSTLRYPEDLYDRLWYAPGAWADSLQSLTKSTNNPSVQSSSINNNVPPTVMQDAWLNDTANSSISFTLPIEDTSIDYVYAAVYTEEIQSYPVGDRIFNGHINGGALGTEVIVSNVATLKSNSLVLISTTKQFLNFSFQADISSLLGPVVNAVEAYAVFDLGKNKSTLQADVDVLADLQNAFNLTDWQGDPCEPVPWDWIACSETRYYDETNYYVARVTELLLSSQGIHGRIPSSISQLEALTEIHLDNNSLSGTIPDSLVSIENLTLLFLDDNNLTGEIPQDLVNKLGSNFSYSGNSLLSGFSPAGAPSATPSTTPDTPNAAPSDLPSSTPVGLPSSTKKKKTSNFGVLVGAVAGGLLVAGAVLCLLIWYFCFRKPTNRSIYHENGEVSLSGKQPTPLVRGSDGSLKSKRSVPSEVGFVVGYVPYEVVRIATENFKEKIGEGSYGSVYHGWLEDKEVAVKLNSIKSDQGQNEFINEVDILTRVHHRNLVSLIGYCNEGEALILIYEYQVNGTLREWLHDEKMTRGILDWPKRLQIASDGAKGLEYLHKGCRPTIIHRDVKSSNILLDDTLTARVADFGLSKTTPFETTCGFSTNVKGTPGYLDPEYHNLGRLTHKSDVYSYGVVMAELITGKPPFIYTNRLEGPTFILLEVLRKKVDRNDIRGLADPNLGSNFNEESMWRIADLALACVDPVAGRRPDFSQIVQGINEAIQIEDPTLARNGSDVSRRMMLGFNPSMLADSFSDLSGSNRPADPPEADHSSPMHSPMHTSMHSPITKSSRYYSIRSNSSKSYQNLK